MPRIEHILFPYDFSRPCTLVAPQVRAVACRFGAKVTLLTVYPTSWDRHSPEMPILKGLDAPEEELKALLGPVAANMFAGIPVEIKTAMGDAAFKIVQFAHDHHVDLIMMPTHGFGTFARCLSVRLPPRSCTNRTARCGPRLIPRNSHRRICPGISCAPSTDPTKLRPY